MAEAYSEAHQAIAEEILGEAFDRLVAAGLGHVEALHGFAHFAIDGLPGFCCGNCLATEYSAIAEAVGDRLEAIPTMDEIAQPAGPTH